MLVKLNSILIFALIAFFMGLFLYPIYIKTLKKLKVGKTIREEAITGEKSTIFSKLHQHKAGTPTMGGGLFLLITLIMMLVSFIVQKCGRINNSLLNRQETYVLLAGFFGMGLIGFIDDILNIKGYGRKKGLSAKAKLIMMFVFSAFISRWFYAKLGVDYINLRPFTGKIHIGIFYPIITFLVTISIVNAINIMDGLDGLAGGLMAIIFFVLGAITLVNQTYIATTLVVIVTAILASFMFFNIFPAKIFMGDSGAFAMGGLLASLLYLLNMRMGIFVPFVIIFLLFILDTFSSALQIFWKKRFKKKLFSVSPFHHLLENKGHHETTIVMKAWMLQALLAVITIIMVFYQMSGTIIN
ncbi:MAG: hypothetical protein M0P94_03915 [Candidatus Absconditabacterales bacterium]|nr:hypothetical protein [Candidatus Absconditabacterales bacterium]